jgi:hypothetical protein
MEQNSEILTSVSQQGGGDSDESWEDQSPEIPSQPLKKKRGKISSNACNKCKRDKKKCDGNYATESTCTYCRDHNEKCTYPEPGRRRPRSNPDIENQQSRVEDTLMNLTRFFNNLSQTNQVNNVFKDQLFQLFVHPSTTVDQFLLLKRLWNEMNNDPNDSRFSVDNLNTLFIFLTILIQNREDTVQLYFWERIRQVVEGTNDIQNMTSSSSSSSSAPVVHPSIFSFDTSDQTISETTDAVVPSQSLSNLLHSVIQSNTTAQYNDDNLSMNVQQTSTTQDNIQFFNSLITENSHSNDLQQQRSTQDSPKQEVAKKDQPKSPPSKIVQEKQKLESNPKQSKPAKPTVKRKRASTQPNESTGSTRTKQRKTKQSPYLDHVHIMYRPVKPESKTSLVFHKEDPIDNSIIFDNQRNTFQAKNQYTPTTTSAQSQYQQRQRQQMPLSFEQWNNDNTNLFPNQQIPQSAPPQKFLTSEQTSQSSGIFSHPEPLPYYMVSPVNDTPRHIDSADIDLILGIGQLSE